MFEHQLWAFVFLSLYLSGTNFRGYWFSRFRSFLPKIAKICTREIFNLVETAKINTRKKNLKKNYEFSTLVTNNG